MIESRTGKPMSENERVVAWMIFQSTRDSAVSVHELAIAQEISEREVKGIIRNLRTVHLLPIGASRLRGRSGYWWARTPEELMETVRPMLNQAKAELAFVRQAVGGKAMLEMLGQEVLAE